MECEGVGGEGSRTMPRFLVSASRRMGFHYLGKAKEKQVQTDQEFSFSCVIFEMPKLFYLSSFFF